MNYFFIILLNNIQELERCGIRFIAVTQGLDTDQRNPASRFLLHVLGVLGPVSMGASSAGERRSQ